MVRSPSSSSCHAVVTSRRVRSCGDSFHQDRHGRRRPSARRDRRGPGSAAPAARRRPPARARPTGRRPAGARPRSVATATRSRIAPQTWSEKRSRSWPCSSGSAANSASRPGTAARTTGRAKSSTAPPHHRRQVVAEVAGVGDEGGVVGGERRLVDQLRLRRPPPVDRRLVRARPRRDRGDREPGVADLDEQLGGGGQDRVVDARGRGRPARLAGAGRSVRLDNISVRTVFYSAPNRQPPR